MEALLGASQSNPSCGSVADLQAQLRDLLSTRVTETRADHTSVTFEIRATAVFDIPVTENEDEALENASNIDPLLGGVRSSVAPVVNGNGTPATRRVNAIGTLINQPEDDPVLQTSITRYIIASLGQVDGSSWMVRHVSRGEQGWTFTYICKDSWQAWSRQASKHPAKTVIAEWSETAGQDPVHLTRPAFDCRGSVKIAFVKSTKTIDVNYEHTPMHKTVAQLIELLAPPPVVPIVRTPAKKAKEPRQPKEPRPPKEPKPKTPRSSKKRVGENGLLDGEGSQPKKRRKNVNDPAGAVLPPEMPGALPVGNSSVRQLYNAQAGATGGVQPGGLSSYPEGLVSSANEGVPDGEVHAHSILNLPPEEAARRREVAIKHLSDNNLDPKTLSAEQFNIFANQSPELQRDSLVMLIKYGAERLRIVHPSKDGASSGQSTPAKQNAPGPQSAKSEKARKSMSEVESTGAANGQVSEAAEGSKRKRICDNCRIKRYKGKCDRARPSCSMCIADGAACVYSAAKPRQSKAAEAAAEAPAPTNGKGPNNEPDDLGSPGFHAEPAGQPAHEPFHPSVHDPGHGQEQYDGHAHHQPADVPETPSAMFNTNHGIYHHSSGLSFPQVSPSSAAEPSHPNISTAMETPSIDYMSNSVAETSEPPLHNFNYPQPPPAPQTASEYTEHTAPAFEQGQHGSSGGQASASRRSLPTGQLSHGGGTSGTNMEAQNTWQSMSGTPSQPTSAVRSSPRQSRTKRPTPVSQAYDDLRPQQQASSWATANQSVSQTTQPVRNSPSQSAAQPARAKSRQSNRAQSHTPVNSMSTARQAPTQGTQSLANSGYASAATTEQPSSAQSYNYNQYQSENTQDSTSSDRVAYQPYSNNQPSAQSSSYSSFDNYNAHVPNDASSTLSGSGSQNVASSSLLNSAATTSNAQWGTSTSTSQARNTRGYNTTQSASSTAYNSSNSPQSQSLQRFSVRPQPQTQTRSSSTTYSQQLQQQQQRQQQHGQQQQQQGYSGYMSQQQQPTTNSQQNWGYGFGAANSSSSGYNSAAAAGSGSNAAYPAASTTSHGAHGHGHAGHGHQTQQQYRSMNLSSHTYMEHDQALYDLLRSNPAG